MFRRIGWQLLLIAIGFVVAALILMYMASTYTTEFRPAPGGTYIEAVGGYPQTLNPLLSFYNDADTDVVSLVYNGMTRMDNSGDVLPDLALGWEVTDGITYTFSLRQDVLWQDGMAFTADDVIFTIELLQDPDYPGPSDIGQLWRSIEATKLDDFRVQFVLPEAYAPFLDYTTISILPRHLLAGINSQDLTTMDFNRSPVGTGPFRVTDVLVSEGQITQVNLRRFTRYFGTTSYIESINLQFYPTSRAAFDAYQDGVVEGISRITLDTLPQAFEQENLQLFSATGTEMAVVYLNQMISDTVRFDDVNVRKALYYGLDRQALVDHAMMGQAVLPQTPLLPGNWAYTTDGVPQYEYDESQASELLALSGWRRDSFDQPLRNDNGDILEFTLMVANDQNDLIVARELVGQWSQLGISVTVQAVPPFALAGVLDSRAYEAALARLVVPGDPDPYPFWHETQAHPGQGQNYAGFQDRTISEIIEQARITTDRAQRKALYAEFQRLFMEQVPALPLYVPVYTYGIDNRVNNGQIGPMVDSGDRFLSISDWYVLRRRVVASQVQTPDN